jgi:hypothetical protein
MLRLVRVGDFDSFRLTQPERQLTFDSSSSDQVDQYALKPFTNLSALLDK